MDGIIRGSSVNDELYARRLRQLLAILVLVLTFEGVVRKAFPLELGVPLFLLKDALTVVMAFYVLRMKQPLALRFLWKAYIILMVLMAPLILMTGWHDLLLAIFGAKEYLLFPMVGFAVFLAFQNTKKETIVRFFRGWGLLLIPTMLIALLQQRLPNDHWLNMSVEGANLAAFSAGGELRVSSTFSFVAQYCAFLNAEMFMLMIALMGWQNLGILRKIIYFSLIPCLVLSCFITGSRSAVAGNISIILLALGLPLIKFRWRHAFEVILVCIVLYVLVLGINAYLPDTTAAYSQREQGQLVGISANIRERVFGTFFSVTRDPTLMTWMGNGLGIMSNGSDTFSPYAAQYRADLWTETDFASTLFEGGFYLALVWYGFRLYVIFATTRRFLQEVRDDYAIAGSFTQGFVIIIGTVGTLAIQPPVAIWWWMGVGTSLLFCWKCVGPADSEIQVEAPPPPRKLPRGRSLYAEVLHSKKGSLPPQ